MKTFTDQLEEILKNKFTGTNHLGEVYFTEAVSEIKSLVLKTVLEGLPEKPKLTLNDPIALGMVQGHNDCLDQVKENMELEFGGGK